MSRFRQFVRATVPLEIRIVLRRMLRETPIRLRDFPSDVRDLLRASEALPPPSRRAAVGLTSARSEYLTIGSQLAADLISSLNRANVVTRGPRRWLDFGCGSGRVARHLLRDRELHLTGIDVDASAIRWCSRHLTGTFVTTNPLPPTPFDDASFDLAYSVSVFTHLDEDAQTAWLGEMHRLLAPGGILIASTHGPELLWTRPDAQPDNRLQLERNGFLFLKGFGRFNDDSAFHSFAYLEKVWSRQFDLLHFEPFGLARYQDLGVWCRR